ncbi:large T antigen [Caerostris darwini]|uniref:Large T antigen n=1 Tax=Caerostris darwini TaxID=1538125 RepID=A0AAV4PHT1_9ARAC|nr:large T antigen [Caerostris darwini]
MGFEETFISSCAPVTEISFDLNRFKIADLCSVRGNELSQKSLFSSGSTIIEAPGSPLKNNINNPRRELLAEQLKELEEVWQLYKTLRPGYSHDQSSGSKGEYIEGEDSYADNTAYSEEFLKISPKKQYDFPDFLKPFFRSESGRRAVIISPSNGADINILNVQICMYVYHLAFNFHSCQKN